MFLFYAKVVPTSFNDAHANCMQNELLTPLNELIKWGHTNRNLWCRYNFYQKQETCMIQANKHQLSQLHPDQHSMHADCMQRNKSRNAKLDQQSHTWLKLKQWSSNTKIAITHFLQKWPDIILHLHKKNPPSPFCVHANCTHKLTKYDTPKGTHDHLTKLKRIIPTQCA